LQGETGGRCVITDTRVMNTKTYVTQYQYNAADRITQITYPSGRVVAYARNANGQVTGVTTKQNATAAQVNVATGITYAPQSDLLTSLTHGNGLVTSAGYDLDYRLTQLTLNNGASPVSSLAYAYSDGMNLTGISDGLNAANSNTLWYTPANRLQNANGPWGDTTNYYDLVGNRTTNINTVGAATTERIQTYAANSNRLNAMTENTAAFRSYTYDNAGNTLTETRPGESFGYTYNKRNRLAAVTRNTLAYASYTYNALEQLTSRNTSAVGAPAGTVHYLYDQDGHLIAEANASTGATTRDYIWLASNDNDPVDLPLAIAETTTLTMVHADHLGRPTRMTDAAKATVWQAIWKPWGEVHSLSGTLTQNLRFPGQYYQIETGLHYNHHRNYDPVTGRYTQADPLGFVDGPSVYAYAGSSPLMLTDRTGLVASLPHSPMPPSSGGSSCKTNRSKADAGTGGLFHLAGGSDCAEQWDFAYAVCTLQIRKGTKGPYNMGGHVTVHACAMGLVSMECGGNKI
jgi:RHS repeat-associated protein